MLQSFLLGRPSGEVLKRKTPPGLRRRGFGIVCCSSPYGALPTTTTTRTTTTAAGCAVFSRVEVNIDGVIRNLCLESLIEFIQPQVFQRDNGNIFICIKMRQRSRFVCYVVQTKKPRQSEVFFQGLRLVTAEHTVLRQRKKYTRSGTNAQFQARILTFLSMDHVANFVHKILFMPGGHFKGVHF